MSLDLINEQLGLQNQSQEGGEMPDGNVEQGNNPEAQKPGASEMVDQNQQSNAQPEGDNNSNPTTKVDEPGTVGEAVLDTPKPQFDWNTLSEQSGGLIKDQETLRQSLERLQKFDEVSNKVTELESNQFKPANDFVSKFNEFVLKGPDKNQIQTFLKVNMMDDLSTMDPREILVTKEMLLKGTPRDVAEYNVDNKYDFALYEENSIEYRALKHNMDSDSKSAVNELNTYKAEVSTVSNPELEAAEQQRLQQVAADEERMKFVKSEAPKMAQSLVPKLSFKVDGDKVFEHSFSDQFKSELEKNIVDFFDKTKLPLNNENLGKVADYLEVQYIQKNRDAIVKDMYNKINSELEEKFANKYQNVGGLPKDQNNPAPSNNRTNKSQLEVQQEFAKTLGI